MIIFIIKRKGRRLNRKLFVFAGLSFKNFGFSAVKTGKNIDFRSDSCYNGEKGGGGMQTGDAYGHGFGELWNDVYVHRREGYSTSVRDYHAHDFYEINLILSGNVRILIGDYSEEGSGARVILTRPGTRHYISCRDDVLYSRIYLNFTEEFARDYYAEWQRLVGVFGEGGTAVPLSDKEAERLLGVIDEIGREPSVERKRLLVYYLLSILSELSGSDPRSATRVPSYLVEVLSYIEANYSERIVAESLAARMHVGRTTLMTDFKRYTGSTLGEYLTHCRLLAAIRLIASGETLEYTAAECGFSDSSGLVRAFRRTYGTTPRRYVESREHKKG